MSDTKSLNEGDNSTRTPPFSWRDIGTREHFVQFYDNDDFLVECVAEYIAPGIAAWENAIVIARPARRNAIAERLLHRGIDVASAIQRGQYLSRDAEETLSTFMMDGIPDEDRFSLTMDGLFGRMAKNGKGLRIFGEMVALLWESRNVKASIKLEQMWNNLSRKHHFSLFCAYPAKGACNTSDDQSLFHVCNEHSRVLPLQSEPAKWDEECLRAAGGM